LLQTFEVHKYMVWEKMQFLNITVSGINSYHWALNTYIKHK